jgi:hypothetical protein
VVKRKSKVKWFKRLQRKYYYVTAFPKALIVSAFRAAFWALVGYMVFYVLGALVGTSN